jgi:hypothetical protein
MERTKRILIVTLLLVTCGTCAREAAAQCAVCDIEGGCFICGMGPEGGTSCTTQGCFRCRTFGTCSGLGPNCAQLATKVENSPGTARLKVEDYTVRQVAAQSTRLASILADLGKDEVLREHSQVYLAPIELTAEDVEWWLRPAPDAAAFFVSLNERAKQVRGAPALVYDVAFRQGRDPARATLTIQLIKGSPADPGKSLLQLTLTDVRRASRGKRQWSIVDWKVE